MSQELVHAIGQCCQFIRQRGNLHFIILSISYLLHMHKRVWEYCATFVHSNDFSISSYLRKFYALSGKLEDMQLGTSCVAVAQIWVPGIGTCDGHRCRIIKQGGLSFGLSHHQLLLHVLKKDARRLQSLCTRNIDGFSISLYRRNFLYFLGKWMRWRLQLLV